MIDFKFFRGLTKKTLTNVTSDGNNILWNLDMDLCLVEVIKLKISRDIQLRQGDTDLVDINFPVRNCWLRIDRVVNWGSGHWEMVEIDYKLIELNNQSYQFTYRSSLRDLMNRLTYG
jgi:hypothetical protein